MPALVKNNDKAPGFLFLNVLAAKNGNIFLTIENVLVTFDGLKNFFKGQVSKQSVFNCWMCEVGDQCFLISFKIKQKKGDVLGLLSNILISVPSVLLHKKLKIPRVLTCHYL